MTFSPFYRMHKIQTWGQAHGLSMCQITGLRLYSDLKPARIGLKFSHLVADGGCGRLQRCSGRGHLQRVASISLVPALTKFAYSCVTFAERKGIHHNRNNQQEETNNRKNRSWGRGERPRDVGKGDTYIYIYICIHIYVCT